MNRVLLLLLLQLPLPVLALSGDRSQQINIESDRLDIDEANGISTYQGNVHYSQGTIVLNADVMVVHSSDGQLQKFEAFGDPAKYKQDMDNGEKLNAESKSMEYYADSEKLILRESVHITKGENEFTGNIVEYSTKDEIVSARKAETGDERVKVIIQPRKQPDEPSK